MSLCLCQRWPGFDLVLKGPPGSQSLLKSVSPCTGLGLGERVFLEGFYLNDSCAQVTLPSVGLNSHGRVPAHMPGRAGLQKSVTARLALFKGT